jgi:hypothetical protein
MIMVYITKTNILNMKGMELPVNTLIILVIAIIVLIAIIAFFLGVYKPSKESLGLETAKDNACQMLNSLGCKFAPTGIAVSTFDADQNGEVGNTGNANGICGDPAGSGDNLQMLCKCWYGVSDPTECMNTVCNCPQ